MTPARAAARARSKAAQTARFDAGGVLTGDPLLDAVIERFVAGAGSYRCDSPSDHVDYWRCGGVDGVPARTLPPISKPPRHQGRGDRTDTWTRNQIMEAR